MALSRLSGRIETCCQKALRKERDTAYNQTDRIGMLAKEEDRADQIKERCELLEKRCELLEKRCELLQEEMAETQSQLWATRWENYDHKIEQILARNTHEWEKTLLDLQ